MGLNVLGGALEFEASIDTTKLEQQLQDGLAAGTASVESYNNELQKSAAAAAAAFNPDAVNGFLNAIRAAASEITPLLQKGIEGFDTKKLEALQQEVSATKDEFEQLNIVTKFIQNNLKDLKLSPEEITQLGSSIKVVSDNFEQLKTTESNALVNLRDIKTELSDAGTPVFITALLAGLGETSDKLKVFNQELLTTDASKAFDPGQLDQFITSITDASQKINTLFDKGSIGLDPASLTQLQQQLLATTDDFQKLKIVSDFVKNNLASFSLNDTEVKNLSGAVDTLDNSFNAAAGSEQTLFQKLQQINTEMRKLAPGSNKAFDSAAINQFISSVTTASAKVTSLLQKGLSGLDPSALVGLQAQLGTTIDEFQRLRIVTDFIKKNLGQLNLSDDEIKQLGAAIQVVETSFDKVSDKQTTVLTKIRTIRNELASMVTNGVDQASPVFQAKLKEAAELEHSLKNVNRQLSLSSAEAPGLLALQQGFRGLVGGAEAAAGIIGFFNDNQAEAEVITKNLVSLMAVLNGAKEVGDIITKKSALNEFLLSKYRQLTAVATGEAAIAQTALTAGQETGIVATEAATVAQVELNAAMLANPVAIILGSIVALFGAYKILESTIFKTTDAEKEHRASVDALAEAQKNAAKGVADEQVSMLSLLQAAKNDKLTRAQRIRAIDELNQKMPELHSNIKLETLYTEQTNQAIEKHMVLVRKKAEAVAIEELLKDKIKEQLQAQIELNTQVEKSTKQLDVEKSFSQLKALAKATEGLKDKNIEVNGVLKTFSELQNKAGESSLSAADKIQVNIDRLKQMAKEGANEHVFDGTIKSLQNLKTHLESIQGKSFDPLEFDKTKEQILAESQLRIDQAKKGTNAELQARKDLIKNKHELDLQDQRLVDQFGKPRTTTDAAGNEKVIPAFLKAQGEFQSAMDDVNQQATDKFLKNVTDSAQGIVLALTRAGQQGSAAYFNAQKEALKKAANAEIIQANDNAGTIKRIKAQLAIDLQNIDVDQRRQQIENDKSLLQIRLNGVREGSLQELDIRKQVIRDTADEELLQTGLTQDKINEIKSNAAKDQRELDKKFLLQAQETNINVVLAGIETRLAAVRNGSEEELKLQKQEVQAKAALDITSAQGQIKNQELLQATIMKIRANSLKDQNKLEEEFFRAQLQKQIDIINEQADLVKSKLQITIDNPNTSLRTKQNAEDRIQQTDITAIRKQMLAIDDLIKKGRGNVDDLVRDYNALQIKLDKAKADAGNTTIKHTNEQIEQAAGIVKTLVENFNALADSTAKLNPGLSETFKELSNIAAATADGIKSYQGITDAVKKFNAAKNSKDGADIAGELAAAADIATLIIQQINKIVQGFAAISASKKAATAELLDFQARIIAGEAEYNSLLRDRERQQVLLNKLTLDGLAAQKKLLEEQKIAAANSFNDLFKKLQQESFVASEGTKGKKSFLGSIISTLTGGASGALKAGEKEISQQLQSLAGKTFDEIEKLFNTGQLTDKAKALFEQLQKIKAEGVDIDTLLAENALRLKEALTGTTSNTIADSIIEGFRQGKKGAGDFADTFQDLMKNAILQSLKLRFLEKPLQDFFNEFANLTDTGGQLTSSEVTDLQTMFNTIITNASDQFAALQQIAGININSQAGQGNSLQGAIKGMTEQQAELLAGQFGGLRLTALDQLNIARQSLLVFNDIQVNTGLAAERLLLMMQKYDSYETGAKHLTVKVI